VTHGLYRVTGNRLYRGHEPGTEFVARLEQRAESRAIARGDLELVDRLEPNIREGSYTLPDGWEPAERSAYTTLGG
jgi:hypothetical protein